MEVEINGIKYKQKQHPKQKPMGKTMSSWLMMANVFAMTDPLFKKPKQMPSIDIVKEYGLIQRKKSNLSANQRKWVVWQFTENFEKISKSPPAQQG